MDTHGKYIESIGKKKEKNRLEELWKAIIFYLLLPEVGLDFE